jgi:hypothetical protein
MNQENEKNFKNFSLPLEIMKKCDIIMKRISGGLL